jgi:CheY-like chemotaxis protein/HPt (histidine-containing phosphotransfer) domain-containing protein
VDDNATNREIIQHRVLSWKMRAGTAPDAPAALAALRQAKTEQRPYDIAILDMHMPGMDGLGLARAIHADAELRGTRLLMLTSIGLEGDATALREAGVSLHLTKPVRQSELYNGLAEVMGRGRIWPRRTAIDASPAEARISGLVLLVEDNPVNQEVAREMLESFGCRVHVAEDGEQGLALLANGRYDAILMDCQMPRMDGFEATRTLRERERTSGAPRVPVIALTANAMTGDRDECLAAGMDDYLSKPFTSTQLLLTLSRWLPAAPAPFAADAAASGSDGTRAAGAAVRVPGASAAAMPAAPPASGAEVGEGEAPLDPSALDAIRALNPERAELLVARVVEAFLRSAPEQLAELVRAAAARDAEALRRAAHSLKSSSANLGAMRLAALAREIEARAREQRVEDAAFLVERSNREFGRARGALAAMLDARRPPA